MTRYALLKTALITILTTGLGGCFTTTSLQRQIVKNVSPASGIKMEVPSLKKAIMKACFVKEWTCTDNGESGITGVLALRTHEIKVEIAITPTTVEYKYISSKNMEYDGTKIHRKYHTWVHSLHNSLRQELAHH